MSFIGIAQEVKNNGFIYEQEGIYIFILCKPQLDYELLGAVKKSDTVTAKKYETVNFLVSRCKKEYPNAEAIIISDIKMQQADCIRLAD